MILPEEIYVVVLEKDLPDAKAILNPDHEVDSIIVETPVRLATKRHAGGLIRRFKAGGHGKALVGRVVFMEGDQLNDKHLAIASLPDNSNLNKLLDTLRPGFFKLSTGEQSRQRFEVLQWVKDL
jgi:hypothetical protein